VEDLVDTGNTLSKTLNTLRKEGAADVKLFAMFNKWECRKEHAKDMVVDFLGYDIPNYWLVGWGMDYRQRFRAVKHVVELSEAGKKYCENFGSE
jgi:hypoxanthine phosphoribosyltransferase